MQIKVKNIIQNSGLPTIDLDYDDLIPELTGDHVLPIDFPLSLNSITNNIQKLEEIDHSSFSSSNNPTE